jgi:hypothetical protein
MTRYLGEPQRTNWTTFGKFASQNAGQQIARLEALEKSFTMMSSGSVKDLTIDFLAHPIDRLKQALPMVTGSPALATNTQVLRDALVKGNISIIGDIGPAFDTFLRAEVNGKDGLAALRRAGYGGGAADPQGYMLQAFTNYQQARRIGDQLQAYPQAIRDQLRYDRFDAFAANARTPEEKAAVALSQQRDRLLYQANLYLGFQEQLYSLQTDEVFGDPKVRALMAVMSKEMAIVDPLGVHRLLPDGGNWADFVTRMGLKDAAPGDPEAFLVRDDQGKEHRYTVDPTAHGTIAEYMRHGTLDLAGTGAFLDSRPERPVLEFRKGLGERLKGWLGK